MPVMMVISIAVVAMTRIVITVYTVVITIATVIRVATIVITFRFIPIVTFSVVSRVRSFAEV